MRGITLTVSPKPPSSLEYSIDVSDEFLNSCIDFVFNGSSCKLNFNENLFREGIRNAKIVCSSLYIEEKIQAELMERFS